MAYDICVKLTAKHAYKLALTFLRAATMPVLEGLVFVTSFELVYEGGMTISFYISGIIIKSNPNLYQTREF